VPASSHGANLRVILAEIAADPAVSQRHLARRLGIALGLTNQLLRRVVSEGWVTVTHQQSSRVRYQLTTAGHETMGRLAREALAGAVRHYGEARERMRQRLQALSGELTAARLAKRIAFHGSGPLAEIAYVSLHETDLQLVAVLDATRITPFFGVPVYPVCELGNLVSRRSFERVAVMSLPADDGAAELEAHGLPRERIFLV
jgi:DNA-binding MarR family transcriptional regulator